MKTDLIAKRIITAIEHELLLETLNVEIKASVKYWTNSYPVFNAENFEKKTNLLYYQQGFCSDLEKIQAGIVEIINRLKTLNLGLIEDFEKLNEQIDNLKREIYKNPGKLENFLNLPFDSKSGKMVKELKCEEFVRLELENLKEYFVKDSFIGVFAVNIYVTEILKNLDIYRIYLEDKLEKSISNSRQRKIQEEIILTKTSSDIFRNIQNLYSGEISDFRGVLLPCSIRIWEEKIAKCKKNSGKKLIEKGLFSGLVFEIADKFAIILVKSWLVLLKQKMKNVKGEKSNLRKEREIQFEIEIKILEKALIRLISYIDDLSDSEETGWTEQYSQLRKIKKQIVRFAQSFDVGYMVFLMDYLEVNVRKSLNNLGATVFFDNFFEDLEEILQETKALDQTEISEEKILESYFKLKLRVDVLRGFFENKAGLEAVKGKLIFDEMIGSFKDIFDETGNLINILNDNRALDHVKEIYKLMEIKIGQARVKFNNLANLSTSIETKPLVLTKSFTSVPSSNGEASLTSTSQNLNTDFLPKAGLVAPMIQPETNINSEAVITSSAVLSASSSDEITNFNFSFENQVMPKTRPNPVQSSLLEEANLKKPLTVDSFNSSTKMFTAIITPDNNNSAPNRILTSSVEEKVSDLIDLTNSGAKASLTHADLTLFPTKDKSKNLTLPGIASASEKNEPKNVSVPVEKEENLAAQTKDEVVKKSCFRRIVHWIARYFPSLAKYLNSLLDKFSDKNSKLDLSSEKNIVKNPTTPVSDKIKDKKLSFCKN